MKFLLAALLVAVPVSSSVYAQDRVPELPRSVTVPEPRERAAADAPRQPEPADAQSEDGELPDSAPLPVARPSGEPSPELQAEPAPPAREIAGSQCIVDLEQLGVAFEREEPVAGGSGCAIDDPVTVSNLGGDVELNEPALLGCPVAAATARFVRDQVQPAARETFGTEVRSIRQSSGYVCRTRHGQRRMSEHATGNALDWASLGLADGREIAVQAYDKDSHEQRFLNRVRKEACGPFKTVLGPGSDADHADHFHFDLAQRRNGGTWCK